MNKLDIAADARRAFDIMKAGGISIVPADTGYGALASAREAVDRVNIAKRRGTHKRNAMICNLETQRELLRLDARAQDIVDTIVLGFDLPICVLGPYNADHPLLSGFDDHLRRTTTASGNLAMLINAGPMARELTKLSAEENVPLLGSSANITGSGAKFVLEEVEPEIRAIADIEVDYGLRKYHRYKRSGTIINFGTMEVVRIGACYEIIKDVFQRFFQIELPPDPGVDALPSGHLNEFGLVGVED